jgi:glycerophosphoryl diester phosphodiesterase
VIVLGLCLLTTNPFFERPILVGAHRGGLFEAPENTITAFRTCAKKWPDVLLHVDARMTVDGEVVLFHDDTLNRTTDAAGPVKRLKASELFQLDAGYHFSNDGGKTFPFRSRGVRVPTLREAMLAMPKQRWMIELKDGCDPDRVIGIIQEAKAEDRTLVSSYGSSALVRMRELAPKVARCFDFAAILRLLTALRGEDWEEYQPRDQVLSLLSEQIVQYGLTLDEIQTIRRKGIFVQIHVLNTSSDIRRWLDTGVDSILSDRPSLLAAEVSRRQKERLELSVSKDDDGGSNDRNAGVNPAVSEALESRAHACKSDRRSGSGR